jgi:ubiquinone/menaquinone biosynthesis C-methylase UbiE
LALQEALEGHHAAFQSPVNRLAESVVMRSTEEWRARARRDPLHAVAAHPGTEGNRWDKEEFYALGRSDWADFRTQWEQYAEPLSGTCVEIGCGAGRITHALCLDFDKVIGLDVSEDMIDLARQVANAEYHVVEDASIPLSNGSADAVFTCHVLQHFESLGDVVSALRESHRVLRDGGTIMAHLLVVQSSRSRFRSVIREGRYQLAVRMHGGQGITVARRYHTKAVRDMFEAAGFKDVQMREFRVTSNGDPHAFWFGRHEDMAADVHRRSFPHEPPS